MGANEMVKIREIDLTSTSEHHFVTIDGVAKVAYIPGDKIIGLSKINRIVRFFAQRPQVQERLTTQIAETLEQVLAPRGVAVVAESIHLCMMMRGVQQQNAFAITSAMRGVFQKDPKTRSEFMELIKHTRKSFA